MPRQRSVFRIEELGPRRARPPVSAVEADAALRHTELMTELKLLRAQLEGRGGAGPSLAQADDTRSEAEVLRRELESIYCAINSTKEEIALLHATGFCAPEVGRVTRELDAVVGSSETATHRILAAGEEIEELATTLAAAIKNIQDQHLARDILDQVTNIFEACNFQDIAGQRVTKVISTMKFIEERILRMMDIWGGIGKFQHMLPQAQAERESHPKLVNGPMLDGDRGYVSQKEIDAMFAVARIG